MPKPIIWAPLSENDFENILYYLHKNWGNKIAAHFIDLTEDILNQIANPACRQAGVPTMDRIIL